MMRTLLAATLLPIAATMVQPATLKAQPGQSSERAANLDWMHGNWSGEATLFGRPAKVRLSVSTTLRGTATALTYTADIPAGQGQPAFHFEGRGTYRVRPDGKVVGQWNDSQGNFHPLAGRINGTTLTVTWGEPRTEVGHSSYVLDAGGTLTVTDSEVGSGQLRTFGLGKYRKE
jgi:hypothetical protein